MNYLNKCMSIKTYFFGCIQQTSQGDVSFTNPKLMFDRPKNDDNHFWRLYIFISTSLFLNFRYFKINV